MPESTCSARWSAISRARAGIGMRSRTFSSSRPVCGSVAMAAPPAAAKTARVRARSAIQSGFGFTPTSSELHSTRAITSISRSLKAVVST